ncbi:MAG: ABC transporter ATP-binding protein [Acidimicrobiia bacterium]
MTPPLVSFEGVGKRYRRGRERINLRAALPGKWGQPTKGDFHWALADLSFELGAGHSLALIGPNGAGKSTTLKLVAGVVAPTKGKVAVNGRTASLIELGAGFHPDMTGRENLYFSAAVLGMGPRTVRAHFDAIVDFAGIGSYLDSPVKRYSSGMLARLGFAVATHLDADVLVLDEVLAVGDAAFQRKCHQRIAALERDGVALLYVTHALWTVPMLCEEAILLVGGEVRSRGTPADVVLEYERLNDEGGLPEPSGAVQLLRELVLSATAIEPGEPLTVEAELDLDHPYPDGHLMVMLTDSRLKVHAAVSSRESDVRFDEPGRHRVLCLLGDVPLKPGSYELYVAFVGDHRLPAVDDMRRVPIQIIGPPGDPAYGVVRLPCTWTRALPGGGRH